MSKPSRARVSSILSLSLLSTVAACSSTSSTVDAGSDAADGNDGATAGDASTAHDGSGGACNSFQIAAPVVMKVQIAAAAPVPAGGTVVDGMYNLTGNNRYTGVGGASGATTGTLSAALQATGSTWQLGLSENAGGFSRETAAVTFSGTTVTQVFTCPPPAQTKPHEYTATPTEIRLYTTRTTGTDEVVLTKQ